MLIGVTGSKGSGKDTLGEYFHAIGFTNVRQAGPLKEMLRTMYREAGLLEQAIASKIEGEQKETPCSILGGATPRHAMQTLGTEWRNMVCPTLWLDIWRRRVETLLQAGRPVICTDIRFKHEAQALVELGGVIVRVVRDIADEDTHVSETEMREIYARYTIRNDRSIEDLHAKGHSLFEELCSCE